VANDAHPQEYRCLQKEQDCEGCRGWVDTSKEREVVGHRDPGPLDGQQGSDQSARVGPDSPEAKKGDECENPENSGYRPEAVVVFSKDVEELIVRER